MNIVAQNYGKALEHAKNTNDDSLSECLKRLQDVDMNLGTNTVVYDDFAPMSFYFERIHDGRCVGNGGVIYHGSHDGYGSGSAPTFSVSITPYNGWSIHT